MLQTYHWAQTVPFVWRLNPGATGVSVFFVISGYLITTLLLREQVQNQRISLKGFYVRRLFRIVPAYLVFLAVVALLTLGGVPVCRASATSPTHPAKPGGPYGTAGQRAAAVHCHGPATGHSAHLGVQLPHRAGR